MAFWFERSGRTMSSHECDEELPFKEKQLLTLFEGLGSSVLRSQTPG